MIKYFIIISVLLSLCPSQGFSQEASLSRAKIYNAYTLGRPDLWKKEIVNIESEYRRSKSLSTLHQLLLAEYGYIALCLKEKLKREASEELQKGRETLAILKQNDPDNPELIAIEAAFAGFDIVINPIRAIFLAGEAKRLTDEAYNKDPDGLISISVKANQLQFTPSAFGGSVNESLEYYKRIIEQYDSGNVEKIDDWRYINTLVILAGAYEKLDRYNEACLIYEKIIATDPDIGWINNGLYPAALKRKSRN